MRGSGTQLDPFIIETPTDIDTSLRNNTAQGVYWELANDIDMASISNFVPIGVASGFRGNFDGKGHKIKNLTINYENIYPSLFAQYFYGTCQNVGVENTQINKNSSLGQRFSGALSGNSYGATFRNCYTTGGYIKAQDESGGLFGKLNASTVEDCYSNNEIVITNEWYGGGFTGSTDTGTTVRRCYSTGKVTYTTISNWSGKSGFAGFVRDNTVVFENCFYDKQTSTQSLSTSWGSPPDTAVVGISGKTTTEMKTQSTYTGWDFSSIWGISGVYPFLKVFGVPLIPGILYSAVVKSFAKKVNTKDVKTVQKLIQTVAFVKKINSKVLKGISKLFSVKSTVTKSNSKRTINVLKSLKSFTKPITAAIRNRKALKISLVKSFVKKVNAKPNRKVFKTIFRTANVKKVNGKTQVIRKVIKLVNSYSKKVNAFVTVVNGLRFFVTVLSSVKPIRTKIIMSKGKLIFTKSTIKKVNTRSLRYKAKQIISIAKVSVIKSRVSLIKKIKRIIRIATVSKINTKISINRLKLKLVRSSVKKVKGSIGSRSILKSLKSNARHLKSSVVRKVLKNIFVNAYTKPITARAYYFINNFKFITIVLKSQVHKIESNSSISVFKQLVSKVRKIRSNISVLAPYEIAKELYGVVKHYTMKTVLTKFGNLTSLFSRQRKNEFTTKENKSEVEVKENKIKIGGGD